MKRLKRIQFKLSTTSEGDIIFPEEAKETSMWLRRVQTTQNPSIAPAKSQFANSKSLLKKTNIAKNNLDINWNRTYAGKALNDCKSEEP